MCQFHQVLYSVHFKFIFGNNSNYFPFKQITHSIKTIESFHLIEPCTELACTQRSEWRWENRMEKSGTQQNTERMRAYSNESGDAECEEAAKLIRRQ